MLPDEQAGFSQALASPGIADRKGDNKAPVFFPAAHWVCAREQG
jgi:hypothetical protein